MPENNPHHIRLLIVDGMIATVSVVLTVLIFLNLYLSS